MCATRRVVQWPLTSIPVSGLFHLVGVSVIQFTKSCSVDKNAVVCIH